MRITHQAIVLILLSLLCFACQRKKGQVLAEKTVLPVSIDTTRQVSKAPPVKPLPPISIQVVGLEKTACYGKCPVFEYKVYNDGRVIYIGSENVDRLGVYEARLAPELINQITSYAELVGFFGMPDQYPADAKDIVELPLTISFVRKNGMEKSVVHRYDAPPGLLDFETFFSNIMVSLDWTKVN